MKKTKKKKKENKHWNMLRVNIEQLDSECKKKLLFSVPTKYSTFIYGML